MFHPMYAQNINFYLDFHILNTSQCESQPLITKPQEAFNHAIAAQLLAEHSQHPMQLLEAPWFEVTGKIGIENWVIQLHLDQLRDENFRQFVFWGEFFCIHFQTVFLSCFFYSPEIITKEE